MAFGRNTCSVCLWALNTLLTLSVPVPHIYIYILWYKIGLRCFNTIAIHSDYCKIVMLQSKLWIVTMKRHPFLEISCDRWPLWCIHTFMSQLSMYIISMCLFTAGHHKPFSRRTNPTMRSITSNLIALECTVNCLAISGGRMASPWATVKYLA